MSAGGFVRRGLCPRFGANKPVGGRSRATELPSYMVVLSSIEKYT